MKKFCMCFILIITMVLCSCGMTESGMTESEMIKKAEDIITNSEVRSRFTNFYLKCTHYNGEDYLGIGITIPSYKNVSEYYAGVEAVEAEKIKDDIYPKLEELVENTEYGTMFAVRTSDGRYVCSYVNGEYVSLD